MRKERKDEHIEQYLRTEIHGQTLLDQVVLEPTSFPELNWTDIDLSMKFLGKTIQMPLAINAMTGGTEKTRVINRDLSILAEEFGLALQVGSQRIALDEPGTIGSFSVIREHFSGVAMGNLGSDASIEDVQRALDMIDGDGIGIHINPSQELVMDEGDREFRGRYANLATLCKAFPGKIIVKEIGFGMSRSDARKLREVPAAYIDVSGYGGTNFIEIEALRQIRENYSEFYRWGVPTAKSIWNLRREAPNHRLIASGGLETATDMIHAMVMGAELCAVSGAILRYLLMGGLDNARNYLKELRRNLTIGMLLLGCRTVEELHKVPYVLRGELLSRIRQEIN
ncbi:MAG: type 2 isopentenyl-diphosphate Delta-isomerase [Peptoniphilaceae bacterium]|nr:type 2 isopentenyl-diphosphate Delta-isomerase [Peptoniphilaceae bacterium]MDY3075091.1 type 2 isopentenyl-diphosphate Delta-isomerase [Peptoniphilaceae bacterium]